MACPDHAGTPARGLDETIESRPVVDERIDQRQAVGGRDGPPGDERFPAILVALVFGPFRMDSLEAPEAGEDLTGPRGVSDSGRAPTAAPRRCSPPG